MRSSPIFLAASVLAGLAACLGTGQTEAPGGETETFEVVGETPANHAPTVPVTATIVFTFNVPIDPSSVNSTSLSANHAIFGDPAVDGTKLQLDPSTDLIAGTTYVITLSPDLKGMNGVSLKSVPIYGFKTAGTAPEPPPDTITLVRPRPR
jgi:hypothetical protein